MTSAVIAVLACAIWVYLLTGRGGFWRGKERDAVSVVARDADVAWPAVVAIVPARDEAAVIGESLTSLLRQDYRGSLSVLVVDDHSSDDTAAIVRHVAASADGRRQVIVVAAPSLPAGWSGKLWAVQSGLTYTQTLAAQPEYLLLTDADIRHTDDSLTNLVIGARRERLVLASLMARLRCVSFAERALVPAFVFFFQMLFPFSWVNRADRTTAAAAGGCMLVDRQALLAAGGVEAIRGELIDDCAMARLLKRRGGAIRLGLTTRVASARAYSSVGEIRRMVARSAYAQLQYSLWRLFAATVAMIVTFVAPPVLAIFARGVPQLMGALAWAMMAIAFQPTLRFYRVSPWWGLALPAIALTYLAFTWDSAWQNMRGRGGEWKGRIHRGAVEHG
ncbi:MAG TPA: glycosyltransferase, partial [Casimicrobiaceae bacterium]|nr:glycosyltransferase [Casimicrobiaceae bacterium]